MTVPAHALDDYFEERLDQLMGQVNDLLDRMDRWLEEQAVLLHRLDLMESCEPLEQMESRRGY